MKHFFISLYILILDAFICYAGYELIEYLVICSNDGARASWVFILGFMIFNTGYLIDSLIEKNKE